MKKTAAIFSLLISLAVCLFLGSQMLLHKDFFYLYDQSRDFMLVKSIVVDHKITLIGSRSGIGGFFHGPLWLYILTPIFLLGKGNPLFFAYFYACIPLITIIAGFLVGKKLYGIGFGSVVAFLLATNSIMWSYINSTQGINLIPLLYIFFILSSILYIRGQQKALFFVAFLTGLAFQFETASAMALLFVGLAVFFLGWSKKMALGTVIGSIAAFFLSLTTFILFDLRHHFLMLTSTVQVFNQHGGTRDYVTFLQRVIDHALTAKNVYLSFLFSQAPRLVVLAIGIFLYFSFLFFRLKWQKNRKKEFLFLSLAPVLVFILYMAYPHPVYGEYVLDLVVSVVFAASVMLMTIWSRAVGKILVVLFFLFTCTAIFQYINAIYPYKPDMTAGSYQNQKAVTDWIWQNAKGKQFGYFVYTPETFTYGMDYLFWWESRSMHGVTPESKKLGETYLIMYPTLANDTQGHAFWKQHTIHTTAPALEAKTFKGDIVVERLDLSHDPQAIDPNYYQNLIFR